MSDKRIFVIEGRGFIAGIIQGEQAAKSFLAEALPNVDLPIRIFVAADKYPFYVVESEDEEMESYMDGVLAKNTAIDRARYKQLVTLYTIDGDFRGDPKKPGADYMGILNHEHFGDNDEPA